MTIYRYLLPAADKKFPPESCEKCPMGPSSRKVGARGTPNAPLVIILEAPGTEELKYGAPICLDQDTSVLMADFTWRLLRNVQIGDEVLSFDEHTNGSSNRRKYRIGRVTAKFESERSCYKVVTPYGELIGTYDHQVLVSQGSHFHEWKTIGGVYSGAGRRFSNLTFLVEPWISEPSYDLGWLGGFLDGEGSLNTTRGVHIRVGQASGVVLDKAKTTLERVGFSFHKAGTTGPTDKNPHYLELERIGISGGMSSIIRVIGMTRPVRLMDKLTQFIRGESKEIRGEQARVLAKPHAGIRKVVDIKVSTGTFIANGFAVHNCGPSGELINKMVPESFDFDDAYIINSMQCRPPKTDNLTKDKEFKAKACTACRARVIQQVFSHPRKCVLAMGAWSNSALTGNFQFKITQQRGMPYAIKHPETGDEVVVVPTVHPAFLLRGSGNPHQFKEDVAYAYNIAYGHTDRPMAPVVRSYKWVDPKVVVLETAEDIKGFHLEAREKAVVLGDRLPIASDIETSGFNPLTDYILSIGFYWSKERDEGFIVPGRRLLDRAVEWRLLQLFRDPLFRFIWQFGKFDEKFLTYGELFGDDGYTAIHEDTGLLSYALSEATKDHDLDEQAKNFLGAPEHKNALKRWVPNKKSSYANVPEPILFDYHAKDLKKTFLLWERHRPIVANDPHLEKLYTQTLLPASHFLAGMEMYGIATDMEFVRINKSGATEEDLATGRVEKLYDDKGQRIEIGLEKEQELIASQLADLAGWNCNPNSSEECERLLFDQFQLKIKGKRPNDTTKETLEKLDKVTYGDGKIDYHPAVKLIRKFRRNVRMLSTYVAAIEKYRDSNGIVHSTYKLHVTPTGRLSSTEPNLQNIPREGRYKRMYCARKGYKLLEGDYNSAELRMLAALSGDKFLTGVFLDDKRNLHDEVSVAMYGPNFTEDHRIRAKAINFGIPYGRDAFSIAMEFDITVREAQRLIDAWFARAPEARRFLEWCGKAAAEGRSLITVFGRKRRPGVVSPERLDGLQNEFKNFNMQSPISDFTLHAAMEMKYDLAKWDAHTVNLIHDATLTEVPDHPEAIQACARIIKDVMMEVPTKWIETPIQFKADLKLGTHWGLGKKFQLEQQSKIIVPISTGTIATA